MEETATRERILRAALDLFAKEGYEAVRVQRIAKAVGIKAPSLYKHFKSKQAIFDAVLAQAQEHYRAQMGVLQMDGLDPARDAGVFQGMGEEQLIAVARGLFRYYLHDAFAAPLRRLLKAEQGRSPDLAALYAKQYVEDPLSFQGALFSLLMQAGRVRREDAGVMALHFYAPVFLLMCLCDARPEMEAEAEKLLGKHIRQFERLYRQQDKENEKMENGGSV